MRGRSATSLKAAARPGVRGSTATTRFFSHIGNDLSVDFANTIYSPDHEDGSLRSAADVLAFLVEARAIDRQEVAAVRKTLRRRPSADARLLHEALRLRAAVRDLLQALDKRERIPTGAIDVVNAVLAADAGFEQVGASAGGRFKLVYRRLRAGVVGALAPIGRAASRLLLDHRAKIRKCANPGCIRYFYDSSRTGARRWCEMAVCGNRAKVAAFLKRRATKRPTRTTRRSK